MFAALTGEARAAAAVLFAGFGEGDFSGRLGAATLASGEAGGMFF